MGTTGKDFAEMFAQEADLEPIRAALIREKVIRETMTSTGESREVVVSVADAAESMSEEAVLALMDGEPTTLRAALQRYVEEAEGRRGGWWVEVASDLTSIINYPWPEEEATVALHEPNRSLDLHIEEADNRNLEIRMGDNRWLIATVNWEEAGSGGQIAAERAAEAVHRAVLARVIADRPHHVQLNSSERRALLAWLERPNGSWVPDSSARVTMDAVEGGGVLVRTQPYYAQQEMPRTQV